MAAQVNANPVPQVVNDTESFVDKHFAKIAFAISTLALAILAPLQFFLGTALGLAIHYFIDLHHPDDKIVTIPNAVFTIVGATAALLRLTPAGAAGGYIFQAIPLLGSIAVGSTAYHAMNAAKH